MSKSRNDSLVREMKRQYRASVVYQVDTLIAARRKWQRRRAIAETKLKDIERGIERMLAELAKEKVKGQS